MYDKFSLLISKILAGEASEEEKVVFNKMMLEEKGDHLMTYNQIKEYWDANIQLEQPINSEEFEKAIHSKIKSRHFTPKYSAAFKLISAAAIFLFIICCSLTYLLWQKPLQIQTYSTQQQPITYTLPDGTSVKLNKNSSIKYLSDFGKNKREVHLKGEGFFQVAKDTSKPFIVKAGDTQTEVLGTIFNVKKEENKIITTLIEGSVCFITTRDRIKLKPGEEITYHSENQKLEKNLTDTQIRTAWVFGRLNYKNISFENLSKKLEQFYNVKINISDFNTSEKIISASFLVDKPIEEILDALKTPLKFHYAFNADSSQIKIIGITN